MINETLLSYLLKYFHMVFDKVSFFVKLFRMDFVRINNDEQQWMLIVDKNFIHISSYSVCVPIPYVPFPSIQWKNESVWIVVFKKKTRLKFLFLNPLPFSPDIIVAIQCAQFV